MMFYLSLGLIILVLALALVAVLWENERLERRCDRQAEEIDNLRARRRAVDWPVLNDQHLDRYRRTR